MKRMIDTDCEHCHEEEHDQTKWSAAAAAAAAVEYRKVAKFVRASASLVKMYGSQSR